MGRQKQREAEQDAMDKRDAARDKRKFYQKQMLLLREHKRDLLRQKSVLMAAVTAKKEKDKLKDLLRQQKAQKAESAMPVVLSEAGKELDLAASEEVDPDSAADSALVPEEAATAAPAAVVLEAKIPSEAPSEADAVGKRENQVEQLPVGMAQASLAEIADDASVGDDNDRSLEMP